LPPDEIPALFTPAHDPAERRKLWLLVAFVLALAVIPDLHWAIQSWLAEPPAPDSVWPAMSTAIHLLERSFRVVEPMVCLLAIWGVLYVCLRRLWHRSEWLSLLVAALTFGSYHIYQGIDGVILITTMGLLHGAFFRLTRRLWPLIIAHAANNIFITLAETFPMISLTGS
jgi:membrane protease YdiL (CAAX protease family)